MAAYNPNSVWESKNKEYEYTPPEKNVAAPAEKASTEPKAPTQPPKSRFESTVLDEPSFFHKHKVPIIAASIVAFFALIGLVIYLLLPTSGPSVSISFAKPDQVLSGSPFIVSVSFSNNSNSILKNASISVTLPDGTSFIGQSSNQKVESLAIGDIGPGSINKQDFNLIVTGSPESVQHIQAKLTYATDASQKNQFETDGGLDIIVGQPAASLSFNAPTNIFSGQNFDITVNYANNTAADMNDVSIALQYPPTFTFVDSSVAPSNTTNNSWDLGTIPAGTNGSFTVTGQIVGPPQALSALVGNFTTVLSGQSYKINTQSTNLTIAAAPLSLSIALNNTSSYIVNPKDDLSYILTYTNNSNITFRGISIKASLVGAMFDLSTLHTNGSLDSRANTITWYGANTPALLALAPGQSGQVTFTLKAKSAYPIRLISDKNYTLKVSAQIESPTVAPNTAGPTTVSVTTIENKINGQLGFTSKGYWRDAAAGIVNTGPYPPKVNQPTEYTVHWDLTNYSTDAQNVTVSAYLQSGTTFTGQSTSNIATAPTYDSATGLVSWVIPNIPATTGVISPPAEAIFQISNTPAVNQVGQSLTLIGPASTTATDAFTGTQLQASAPAISSDIPDDKTINLTDRRVTQ